MSSGQVRELIKGQYRAEIDGLRAFAVISVVINHFNKDILPGGYLGVDIFFVISGYVITSSLYGRPSEDFKDFISGFYERRIRRIVPALLVFVLIMSIAICLFDPSPKLSLRTGITSLFGLSNLYLLKLSTDYFAQLTELNVFAHTWSLGVEEQFYILFPFLIWFSGFGRQTKNGARNLFGTVAVLAIASLIRYLYIYTTNPSEAYFSMPLRFWEIASGCLSFIGFHKRASVEQILEKIPPLLVLVLIVWVMYLPMSWGKSTVAVVALSSVLIAALKQQTAAFKILTNPKIVYIGLISYSLYLWHWGVLSISRWTIGIHWWSVPFQLALMLGLAVASNKWIETPLRKSNWSGKRRNTLMAGVGTLILSVFIVELIQKTVSKQLFESIGNKIYPYTYTFGSLPHQDLQCHLPKNIITAIQDCLSPPTPSPEGNVIAGNIFLVGDSHATNHYWSIDSALRKIHSGFTLRFLVEHGFINYLIGFDSCGEQSICIENAGNVYKDFFRRNLKAGDFLFISISRDRFTIGPFNGSARKQDHLRLKVLRKRLLDLSQIAEEATASIVLIGNIPKVCPHKVYYSINILRDGNIGMCETSRMISLQDRSGLNQTFIDIATRSESVIYLDPHDELCTANLCNTINNNGVLLYADTSPHFTKNTKEMLSNYWVNNLAKLGIANALR